LVSKLAKYRLKLRSLELSVAIGIDFGKELAQLGFTGILNRSVLGVDYFFSWAPFRHAAIAARLLLLGLGVLSLGLEAIGTDHEATEPAVMLPGKHPKLVFAERALGGIIIGLPLDAVLFT